MAARSIASLLVSFGMVSIPVKLYAATQATAGISFNLLHGACGSRLRQQYVCIKEDVVVERADMVKGYEFAKDQYVTFTPEELTALGEKATQTVEIDEFVPAESIDPIYYDKAYFLGPDKGGAKPYALLAESMRKSKQTAVGRYAARGKQYIVQLRPVAGGLVMQQLLYAPEVRSIDDVDIPEAPVRDAELDARAATDRADLVADVRSDEVRGRREEADRDGDREEARGPGNRDFAQRSRSGRPGDRPDGGVEGEPRQDAGEAARREGCRRRGGSAGRTQGRAEEDTEESRRPSTRAPVQKRKAGKRS